MDITDPEYMCPYALEKCKFYDLSVDKLLEYFVMYEEIPEELRKILSEKMEMDDFEIAEKECSDVPGNLRIEYVL